MALETSVLLTALGVIVVAAFFAALLFQRFKIPDIIFLIALGVVLGPVLHFVDVELFRGLVILVGTVAIIIILFEGGMKIRREEILAGVASGGVLALAVFVATTLLCALVANLVAGYSPTASLLLGMCLGGAGVVIVIPLIQQMGVTPRAVTVVSVEAAVSDVLVVIGVVGLSTALTFATDDPTQFLRSLLINFMAGVVVGVAAGLGWVQALRAFRERSYEYVLTMAALFLLYAGTEAIHGSGPLAVLFFGLVIGNSRKTRKLADDVAQRVSSRRKWEYVPVFGTELANLHHEVVFFIRAFFFVTLGVVVDLELFATPRFLGVGLLLTLGVVVARYWGVTLLFSKDRLAPWDRLSVSLMFPLGLAAAVLSLIPYQRFGIHEAVEFGNYAAVTIVMTNVLSALLVFVLSNPRFGLHQRFQTAV